MSRPTLHRGDEGLFVGELQQRLVDHGHSLKPYGIDEDFGPLTERRVKDFQEAAGLEPTGVVDEDTWAALDDDPPETVESTGLDISHHQRPEQFDWHRIASDHAFMIARATYGTKPDKTFAAHVAGARSAGMASGAYHFFRQHQDADEQLKAFDDELRAVDYGCGDLFPALDLEHNSSGADGPVSRHAHNMGGRYIAERLAEKYGGCLVYLAPGHMLELDQPDWIQQHTIWVAHIRVDEPAWPWGGWKIWQKTWVHKHEGFAAAALPLDLNVCRGALPLIKT